LIDYSPANSQAGEQKILKSSILGWGFLQFIRMSFLHPDKILSFLPMIEQLAFGWVIFLVFSTVEKTKLQTKTKFDYDFLVY